MKHFFITGLPRSRTKWLSNFMTYGGAFCFHEGLEKAHDRDYLDMLKIPDYDYVGDASTYLPLMDIPQNCPIVIIKRDKNEVIKSLIRLFGQPSMAEQVVEMLAYKLSLIKGLEIDYNEIDDKLDIIWNYCVPGLTYDPSRAEALTDMRIEVKDYQRYHDMLRG